MCWQQSMTIIGQALERTPHNLRSARPVGLVVTIILAMLLGLAPEVDRAESYALRGQETVTILAFGDSLTAGYGLAPEYAFPAQLEARLRAKGHAVRIVNAGISGDTAEGGLERLDWVLPDNTDAVILELGANDALRGYDPEKTKELLDRIIVMLRQKNIEVLLAGMHAPRNWGQDYAKAFAAIYPALAQKHNIPLYPFFLQGVAMDPALQSPRRLTSLSGRGWHHRNQHPAHG